MAKKTKENQRRQKETILELDVAPNLMTLAAAAAAWSWQTSELVDVATFFLQLLLLLLLLLILHQVSLSLLLGSTNPGASLAPHYD